MNNPNSFNIGDVVKFTGYFERGVVDYGVVYLHEFNGVKSLALRGRMNGFTKCGFEIYLDSVLMFDKYKLKKLY